MKKHTKIYLTHFNYTTADFIPCEVCKSGSNDLHHIECRGMGGSKKKDYIENIMALCRNCHEKFGDKKQYMNYLKSIHKKVLTSIVN